MNDSSVNSEAPGWMVMLCLAFAIYALLKGLSWFSRKQNPAECWKDLAYLFLWPGMDVDRFLSCRDVVMRPSTDEWLFAAFKFTIGLGLLIVAVLRLSDFGPNFAGWVGMFGIVFSLHFGLFHVLSLTWRFCGRNADPIMNWPIVSVSLAEFWGRRWNLAFRDLTHRFIFRPLVPIIGASGSLMAGFFVSGLIHDLVISLPSESGYGGPTTFFVLQAAGTLAERSRFGRFVGLGQGLFGRLFCAATLLVPLPLLFHRPFICRVIVPFLETMRRSLWPSI